MDRSPLAENCEVTTRRNYQDERFIGITTVGVGCSADMPQIMIVVVQTQDDPKRLVWLLLHSTATVDLALAQQILTSLHIGKLPSASLIDLEVDTLTLRAGPGSQYQRKGTVKRADALLALAQVQDCAWLLIQTPDNGFGWVPGQPDYLTLRSGCAAVPDLRK